MRRRALLLGFAAAAIAAARRAFAETSRPFLIGIATVTNPRSVPMTVAFEAGLRELGHLEGKDIALDFRELAGDSARLPAVMADFARRPVDLILAHGPEAQLRSARAATERIPIVMVAIDYDPLARGYISNLARPAGNITGVFLRQIELARKRLDLLKEALPEISGIILPWDASSADQTEVVSAHATELRLGVRSIEFRAPPYDYERAFGGLGGTRGEALFAVTSPFFFNDRKLLVELARQLSLPSSFAFREHAVAGGLASYGASISGMYRLAADYVDRVIRGAKPSDLPVQQPTKFELVINLKTAKALDLVLPPAFLARADEVIE
jgi:putative ABC transport system substrate-binding protein